MFTLGLTIKQITRISNRSSGFRGRTGVVDDPFLGSVQIGRSQVSAGKGMETGIDRLFLAAVNARGGKSGHDTD